MNERYFDSSMESQAKGKPLICDFYSESQGNKLSSELYHQTDSMNAKAITMTKINILLVDDEKEFREGLSEHLRRSGYYVFSVGDGMSALETLRYHTIDLVILDIRMPGLNGFEVCKRLRKNFPSLAVIFLSAMEKDIDVVNALMIGGDDYVRKPFSTLELLARMKSVLGRRSPSSTSGIFQFGNINVNLSQRMVYKEDILVTLTLKEFNLFHYFLQHPEEALGRNELLENVWGHDQYPTTRTVDFHVLQLRKKIERNPETPNYILTIRGIGYKFSP